MIKLASTGPHFCKLESNSNKFGYEMADVWPNHVGFLIVIRPSCHAVVTTRSTFNTVACTSTCRGLEPLPGAVSVCPDL